ncbi:MAG: pyridoxal-dependent decarboxylase, partial [Ignavibacterium sp.]|nr:pyridoxal-dependent decarboxylase [Ignavibacterium sp.]
EIKKSLNSLPPIEGRKISDIVEEFEKKLTKGITHWNHPGFMAYFNSSSSEAGILSEFLISALNLNGMLWITSPVATELEEIVISWFRNMVGLSDNFWGIIYDTASISTFHALGAAREKLDLQIKEKGLAGRNVPKLTIYCSEHAHSSIEKSAIALGIGQNNVKKIKTNEKFEMDIDELRASINSDFNDGAKPFCVVATVGTTSFASIDPIEEISKVCKEFDLWLHIDAAYAGVAAILPEMRGITKGWENSDSIVINPHKWMFTPMDCSIFLIKDKNILKRAFTLVPEYLKTKKDDEVDNLMDYGLQLGRRFRALKLWFIINNLGVKGIESKIRNHINWAKDFANWVENHPHLFLISSVHFSTVCFQFRINSESCKDKINYYNQKLLEIINSSKKIFISNTKLKDQIVLRITFGSYWQEERHIELAKNVIQESIDKILRNKIE